MYFFVLVFLLNSTCAGSQPVYHSTPQRRNKDEYKLSPASLVVDVEGNLVLSEVLNSVTHGIGIVLALWGTYVLMGEAQVKSSTHTLACGLYCLSLVVLYTSSTLYHSFFAMKRVKAVMKVYFLFIDFSASSPLRSNRFCSREHT